MGTLKYIVTFEDLCSHALYGLEQAESLLAVGSGTGLAPVPAPPLIN
jgi:hypothetical protein